MVFTAVMKEGVGTGRVHRRRLLATGSVMRVGALDRVLQHATGGSRRPLGHDVGVDAGVGCRTAGCIAPGTMGEHGIHGVALDGGVDR